MSAQRVYTFVYTDGVGVTVTWADSWYDRFEGLNLTVTSRTQTLSDAFALPQFTYTANDSDTGKRIANYQVDPFGPASEVSVAAIGPGLLGASATFTYWESISFRGGKWEGIGDSSQATVSIGVDVARGLARPYAANPKLDFRVLWDYVATFDGTPAMLPVGSAPVTLPFPGDYRLPANAQYTRMLTDDELFAVSSLQGPMSIPATELLGILLELTGARRDAYHPAGHYGISNLTAAQLAVAGTTVERFVGMSVRGQLAVTHTYLDKVGVRGALPVYFTLATGQPCPTATASTQLTVGGVPVTGSAVTQQILTRATKATLEFAPRLPAAVSPTLAVTG